MSVLISVDIKRREIVNYGSADQELITVPGGIGVNFGTPDSPGFFFLGLQGHAQALVSATSGSITASLGGSGLVPGVCTPWSGGVNFLCELYTPNSHAAVHVYKILPAHARGLQSSTP
jgi:hypothetical protein